MAWVCPLHHKINAKILHTRAHARTHTHVLGHCNIITLGQAEEEEEKIEEGEGEAAQ